MINLTREFGDTQLTYLPAPDSGCESRYELHEGLLVIPILGDPLDTPVVVRVHSPFTIRRATFSYAKAASPPLIPSPGDTRTNHTFLSGAISVAAPGGSSEGTLTYKASGNYTFLRPQHVTVDGKIMFDAHPFLSGVDELGAENSPADPTDPDFGGYYNTWKSQYFDLASFSSARILG